MVQVVSKNKVLRIAKGENRNVGQKQKKSKLRGIFFSHTKMMGMVEEEAILCFSICLTPDWKFSALCHKQTEPIPSSVLFRGIQLALHS